MSKQRLWRDGSSFHDVWVLYVFLSVKFYTLFESVRLERVQLILPVLSELTLLSLFEPIIDSSFCSNKTSSLVKRLLCEPSFWIFLVIGLEDLCLNFSSNVSSCSNVMPISLYLFCYYSWSFISEDLELSVKWPSAIGIPVNELWDRAAISVPLLVSDGDGLPG